MCGISGFIYYENPEKEKYLKSMISALAHRGPDGEGTFLNKEVGLAHRRLAIIDLECGEQPMFSVDKRFGCVFNGEIYNYLELRNELKSRNCEFRTNSDTEVIAEAVRCWGIEQACLKFRGMFAFALYDFNEKKLYLGRDRLGIKPLYYSQVKQQLFFASEQKSLLKIPEIPRSMNPTAIHDFFTLGFPVTPETCWKYIQMFPPAHYAVYERESGLSIQRYWQWEPQEVSITFNEARIKAEAVLKDSLTYHLRSDVPLAAFLSGGIDSSLIARFLKDGLVEQIKTFNVGFEEAKYDESGDAALVAEICKTEHHQIRMQSKDANPELFERIMLQYDEPYGDSSCLPTYSISEEMRKHVKTVISGDGGDELFGGYDRFPNIRRINMLRKIPGKKLFQQMISLAGPLIGDDRSRQLAKALEFACEPAKMSFCRLHTYFSEAERKISYVQSFHDMLKDAGPTWQRMNQYLPGKSSDLGEELAGLELVLNVHGDYLRKVDIASSAHGLEVRVPFLDPEVIHFSSQLPFQYKVNGNECKYLLRKIASDRISPKIGNKEKQGFGIPFDSWCKGGMQKYLENLLFSIGPDEGVWQIFRKSTGTELWKMFIAPQQSSHRLLSRLQVYQRIFMLASTQIWMNHYKLSL